LEHKYLPGETVFPFVHGEQVEKMRLTMRDKMRFSTENNQRSSSLLSHDGDFQPDFGLESLRSGNAKDNLIRKFCTVGSS
jgi:hypothetical protein